MKNSIRVSLGGLFLGAVACSGIDDGAEPFGTVGSALGEPWVATGDATEVGEYNARLGVTLITSGASSVTECGVCWGPVGSGTGFVTQTDPTTGVRCMRQIPCLSAAYFTSDGYMDQRPYVPGTAYDYRGYAINANGIAYGALRSFRAAKRPSAVTGPVTVITQTFARLGVTVPNSGTSPVTECGVCWGPQGASLDWVDQLTNGVRCMRQIPCLQNAYRTDDGYMALRPYSLDTTYDYRAYAISAVGISYGAPASFRPTCSFLQASCWSGPYGSSMWLYDGWECGTSFLDQTLRMLDRLGCKQYDYSWGKCYGPTGCTCKLKSIPAGMPPTPYVCP
jgi:hypothetical protein